MVKGSSKKGKLADLTVILQDIMKLQLLENQLRGIVTGSTGLDKICDKSAA